MSRKTLSREFNYCILTFTFYRCKTPFLLSLKFYAICLRLSPGMTVESLDAAVVRCLESGRGIRMGIGRLYFYRSLYAVQLHNCFKVNDRDCQVIYRQKSNQLKFDASRNCQRNCISQVSPFLSSHFSPPLAYSPEAIFDYQHRAVAERSCADIVSGHAICRPKCPV